MHYRGEAVYEKEVVALLYARGLYDLLRRIVRVAGDLYAAYLQENTHDEYEHYAAEQELRRADSGAFSRYSFTHSPFIFNEKSKI